MEFLNDTKNLVLTLTTRNSRINLLVWHVDRAYQLHHDLRSQTGIPLSLGKEKVMIVA